MQTLLLYILSIFIVPNHLPTEIQNRLEKKFTDYSRVEFEVNHAPTNWNHVQLNNKEDIKVIGNVAYVPILETKRSGKQRHATLSVKVKLYNKVFVAIKDVEKRGNISPIDFELVEKEVSSTRGKPITSIGEIVGCRAKMTLKKGDILTEESIEKMPVIFPGDNVLASSVVGNVQVSFKAVAKQEGRVGDIIRIKNSSNKIFKAEVIDNQNVLIVE